MVITVGNNKIELCQGDITDQEVDAIVNAANSRLLGGGGVDGAIHDRAGPSVMQETQRLYPDGCPTGSAVVTNGGDLQARLIFHAVGPIWRDGKQQERDLLRSAYLTCLRLATDNKCESIAFPSISTGAYGFPIKAASRIALATAADYLNHNELPRLVRFVLFDAAALSEFEEALQEILDDA